MTALARVLVTRLLRRVEHGTLTILEPGRSHRFGPPDEALRATVTLHDAGVWRAVLRGSTGLAESHIDGRWDADDLTALLRIAARNAPKLDRLRARLAFLVRPVQLLEAAGYDARFRRLWELYLRYCEAGFTERRITDVQALFAKPAHRSRSPASAALLALEQPAAERVQQEGRAA
jgi:hypothetical protein